MLAGEFIYKSIWSLKYIELKYIFVHSKIEITSQSRYSNATNFTFEVFPNLCPEIFEMNSEYV